MVTVILIDKHEEEERPIVTFWIYLSEHKLQATLSYAFELESQFLVENCSLSELVYMIFLTIARLVNGVLFLLHLFECLAFQLVCGFDVILKVALCVLWQWKTSKSLVPSAFLSLNMIECKIGSTYLQLLEVALQGIHLFLLDDQACLCTRHE